MEAFDKLGRRYRLIIGDTLDIAPDGASFTQHNDTGLTIFPPFTVEFDINRSTLASTNVAQFRIFNLSEHHRKRIYKDSFQHNLYKAVQFDAGYGDQLSTVFKGSISRAWSVREGVNYVTTIECFDGGEALLNAQTNLNFPKGTSQADMMNTISKQLKPWNVQTGVIGDYPDKNSRGNTRHGNAAEHLDEISQGGFFVDLERVYCLNDNECLRSPIDEISSESGLLGTPVRQETYIYVDLLFEPRVVMAQKLTLKSKTMNNFNTEYRVVSIKHRGVISESVCGDAVTTLGLFSGSKALTVVN